MAFEKLTESLQQVVDRIEDYGSSTAEYFKLRLFKSAMKFSTALVNMLVIGFISFLFLIFVSISVALYLSTIMENPFAGFMIVGGFYLFILLLTLFFGKGFIEQKMLLKFSDLLIEEDEPVIEKISNDNLRNDRMEDDRMENDAMDDVLDELEIHNQSTLTPINEKSNL